jgi:putative addiction module CopG family antidote
MNISLTPELEKLVLDKVKSGMYLSSSEVIREALRLLEERDRIRELQRIQLARDPQASQPLFLPEETMFEDKREADRPATAAVRCPRTLPIGNDAGFAELGDQINRLLARWGFTCRRHKGSLSWVVQPGTPLADQPFWKDMYNETLWKLCYYGPNDAAFGIRRDLARRITVQDRTLADLRWPLTFGVPPQSQVVFLGFPVSNDGASVDQVARVLKALGESDPTNQVSTQDTSSVDFQQEMSNLGI